MIVRIISVPYASGRADFRSGRGPQHLLELGFVEHLQEAGVTISAVETLVLPPDKDTEVEALFALHSLLSEAVSRTVAEGLFPLILAGNCSSTIGTVSGLQKEELGIVWLDAHGDYNTPETTTSGFLDGMALSILTGICWQRMAEGVPGFEPIEEQRIIHIGGRHFDEEENILMHGSDMYLLLNEDLQQKGISSLLLEGIQSLKDAGVMQVHLHFDLDVLDPREAPANFHENSVGLSVVQAIEIIRIIRQHFPLASAAFTAYDPTFDPQNKTVHATKSLAQVILTAR